jgi:Primosomal protein N'' (replication factor Y) - superfamily II helicase
MIRLLTGKKGSGKTKKLIELANKALEESKGCVVVLEKGLKLTYDISHKARLVDTDAYSILSEEGLYGFISGICAGNYDVTDILVDSTLKIIGKEPAMLSKFVEELKKLNSAADVSIVLSVSASDEEIPDELKEFILN